MASLSTFYFLAQISHPALLNKNGMKRFTATPGPRTGFIHLKVLLT
jgi:hypothetical protein